MKFEEAIEIIEDECRVEAEGGFSTKENDLDTFLALSIIKNLQETYAPKIKMTLEQRDELMRFLSEDEEFEDFCYGYRRKLYKEFSEEEELYKEFTENDLMQAWLHPELIEVVDD